MSTVATEQDSSLFQIERTVEFTACIERVWAAITDAKELALWFPNQACDFKPEVGYEGWFEWQMKECSGRFAVLVEQVEAPNFICWSWAREPGRPIQECWSTRVEWRLESMTDGGTRLHLRESGFENKESHAQNTQGWQHELAELEALLAA